MRIRAALSARSTEQPATPAGSHLPLLQINGVSAIRSQRSKAHPVLRDVDFEIAHNEYVAVFSKRAVERSALLRVAGGIEVPSSGAVLFECQDLRTDRRTSHIAAIGFVSRSFSTVSASKPAPAHVAAALLPQRFSYRQRMDRAYAALDRVGAPADAPVRELTESELTLVAIARALVIGPRLLLVDEPHRGFAPGEASTVTRLLGSVARSGTAVLATYPDVTGLVGAHRALHLSDGVLRGRLRPHQAQVIALPERGAPAAGEQP